MKYSSIFGKRGTYKGIWCDSSWELAYVVYCLDHEQPVRRNIQKFPYKYNRRRYNWVPDFIVEGKYVEIKGYEPPRDKAKIAYFNRPLQVIREQEMKPILAWVKAKYGEDFTNLYDD